MNKVSTVYFHDHALTVITGEHGEHLVAMKPICEAIGLDWSAQLVRIKRDEVLSSTMVITTMVADDGKNREFICLPLDYLNGWLFGIEVSRCREEIRPTLIQYKRECYAALAAYWQGNKQPAPTLPEVFSSKRWLVHMTAEGHLVWNEVQPDMVILSMSDMTKAIGKAWWGCVDTLADLNRVLGKTGQKFDIPRKPA